MVSSMSKKKKTKSRTYSEGEFRKAIKQISDDAVAKILTLCVTAAADEFDLDEDGVVKFMERMERYVNYEQENLIKMKQVQESLKKSTGIDLCVRRW